MPGRAARPDEIGADDRLPVPRAERVERAQQGGDEERGQHETETDRLARADQLGHPVAEALRADQRSGRRRRGQGGRAAARDPETRLAHLRRALEEVGGVRTQRLAPVHARHARVGKCQARARVGDHLPPAGPPGEVPVAELERAGMLGQRGGQEDLEAERRQPARPGRQLEALRARRERDRRAVDGECELSRQRPRRAAEVRVPLLGVERAVSVAVEGGDLLIGGNLRHVDDVADGEHACLDAERSVAVHAEVAERMRGGDRRQGEGEHGEPGPHRTPSRAASTGRSSAASAWRASGAWRRSKCGFRRSARRR